MRLRNNRVRRDDNKQLFRSEEDFAPRFAFPVSRQLSFIIYFSKQPHLQSAISKNVVQLRQR